MLGYMTAKEAVKNHFTHHGSYYGVPIWIRPDYLCPMVATKWAPMELVVSLLHVTENACHWLMGTEPTFKFCIGEKIEVKQS